MLLNRKGPAPCHSSFSTHLRHEPTEAVGGIFAVVDDLVLDAVVGKGYDGGPLVGGFGVLVRPGRIGACFGVVDADLCGAR